MWTHQAENRWIIATIVLALTFSVTTGRADTQQAKQILDATGVRGGLIVHVGCGDGKLTCALRANDSYIVHGLDKDPANVAAARTYAKSLGQYGDVSVDIWSGDRLPYIDNTVNLVVSEDLGGASKSEVMRVLAPNGVAYIKNGDTWTKTIKPRPKEIDEWTHYMHDATGNAVAHDSIIGPPDHLQWVGSPRWSRHHDHMSSVSAVYRPAGEYSTSSMKGPPLPSCYRLNGL